jgi:hypothetical protein
VSSYTKLFSSIIHSTIWQRPGHVRLVWVTMLAMVDRHGEVQASVPGLARAAGVTIQECEEALADMAGPDPYSRTPDNEGRRIEAVEGGWTILNHAKYRVKLSPEDIREKARIRKANYRAKLASRGPSGTEGDGGTEGDKSRESRHTDTDTDADADPNADLGVVRRSRQCTTHTTPASKPQASEDEHDERTTAIANELRQHQHTQDLDADLTRWASTLLGALGARALEVTALDCVAAIRDRLPNLGADMTARDRRREIANAIKFLPDNLRRARERARGDEGEAPPDDDDIAEPHPRTPRPANYRPLAAERAALSAIAIAKGYVPPTTPAEIAEHAKRFTGGGS